MQTEKSLELRASSQHVETRITLMTLLPAKSQADKLEGNLVSVAVDQLPGFTELDTSNIKVQKDDEGHILLDGKLHTISRAIESALRLLRLPDTPHHVLGEVFQRNAQEIAWVQFELRRPAETFAFWREVTKTEALEGKLKLMDRFVILPNRYLNTPKFYTVIDTSPESREIRLLVLPPSGGLTSNTLRCEFRNFTLNDPSLPRYQLFHVAGPANPRNGHRPTYTYDISINGHVCVTSDGMRPGLQQLQDEKEERFVWNAEMCFNCRDRVEVQHFERLNDDILKNASEGAVLLYDHLSAFTPTLNRNGKFKLPIVNRQAREIRLLQFNHGESSDDISCKLVVKDLDSMPIFKALSYTWGNGSALAMHYTSFNPDDDVTEWPLMGNSSKKGKTKFLQSFEDSTERITVNKMPVLITKHLGSALRCLRDRGDGEYFWIDALCIDQSDWADRNNQVGMMGDIYSLAQQVIAWLGSSDVDDNTLDILNELGSDSFDFEEFIAWAELNGTTTSIWGDHGASDGDPRFQRILKCLQSQAFSGAVDQFVNHEWWHRVWIFQEAILPSSLVLHRGIYSITFETLWTGVDVIRRLSIMDLPLSTPILAPGMKRGLYAMLAAIRQERQRRHNPEWIYTPVPNEFIYYVETLGTRSASDPRDIIYAALGLTESAPRTIVPNYSKSIMEVFTIAAKETIKHSDDLLLLSLCGGVMDTAATWAEYWMGLDTGVRKKSAPLPTWVPYWGTQHRLGMGAQRLRHDWMVVPDFSAGGSKASGAKFSKDGRILFLKGVVVDVVKSVVGGYKYKTQIEPVEKNGHDGLKFTLDRSTWLETFSNWEKAVVDIQPRSPEYVNGGLKVDALMHALHAPFLHHCITGASSEEIDTKDALSELYQPEEKPEIITPIKPSSLAQTLFDRENALLSSNLTITKDYELLVTEKGYIGVSPPGCSEVAGVHVGDIIVVLSGGSVPFILRQVGKHDRFLLINDAYVHGIMYGEVMKDVKDDDRRRFPII